MPKTHKTYTDQVNILAVAGTLESLIAISYYRGGRGVYADPARDFLARGIREFVESLPDKERKRYDEILANVRVIRNSAA